MRELGQTGFRFVAFGDQMRIGAADQARDTLVTLRRGILGAPSMPGLGDVPRVAGVL